MEVDDEVGVGGSELSGMECFGFVWENGEYFGVFVGCVEEKVIVVVVGDGVGV